MLGSSHQALDFELPDVGFSRHDMSQNLADALQTYRFLGLGFRVPVLKVVQPRCFLAKYARCIVAKASYTPHPSASPEP